MLHHISLGVRDLRLAGLFYDAALGASGYRRVFEDDTAIGYGIEDDQDLLCLKLREDAAAPGAPGPREDYGDHYYAAFLVDPDGHRIEAVNNRAPA